ncbi:unnamed protein product, partial [Aphanomyces euteiches]
EKTTAEIEAERWAFVVPYAPGKYCLPLCTVQFRRWMLFLAAFVVQFCNGSLFAWSVLNQPIDNFIQGKARDSVPPAKEMAVVTFYITAGVHGCATALFGPFVERHGPRHSLIVASSLFFVGHVVSFVSVYFKSYVGLYIGYGVFCGAGFGIAYIAPVSALLKWFPDLRGTAGGFAVCGVGLGTAFWGRIYPFLIESLGTECFFLVFGLLLCLILLISSCILRTPPPNYVVGGRNVQGVKVTERRTQSVVSKQDDSTEERVSVVLGEVQRNNFFNVFDYQELELGEAEILYHNKIKSLRIRECVFSVDFVLLYLVFVGASVAGTNVMSRVYNIAASVYSHVEDDDLIQMVATMSIANFFGQVLCPLISDKYITLAQLNPAFGRKIMLGILMVTLVVVLVLLKHFIQDANAFVSFQVTLCFLTFSYGGILGTLPSFLTDMYGVYNSGTMHGIIFTAWSVCAIGGGLTFQHYFLTITSAFPIDQLKQGMLAAYAFNFHWLFIVACIGCGLILFVRTNPVDRFFPGYQYSLCGRPVVRIAKREY